MLSSAGRLTWLLLYCAFVVLGSGEHAPCRADDWPMMRHDARNTATTAEEIKPPMRLLWRATIGTSALSTLLVSGGVVCAVSGPANINDTSKTYIFNRKGTLLWTLKDALPLYLQGPKLIVMSRTAERAENGGQVQGYDWKTQKVQWSQSIGGVLNSLYGAVVDGERLYVSFTYAPPDPKTAGPGMSLGALKVWSTQDGRPIAEAVGGIQEWAIGPPACDGKTVYQGLSHHLDARDANTLTLKTSWYDGGNAYPIVTGRQLIVKGWMGFIHNWNLDTRKQNWLSGGPRDMPHCLVKDGHGRELLIESSSALDAASGKTVWKSMAGVVGDCAAGVGHLVYMAGRRPGMSGGKTMGGLYAFDADTGALRWKYEQPGLWGISVIAAKGRLYALFNDGVLYCFASARASSAAQTRGVRPSRR